MKTFKIRMIPVCLLFIISGCKQEHITYPTAAIADFSFPQEEYEIGEDIVLTDLSIPDDGNEIVYWEWDFGDPDLSTSTDKSPTVRYAKEGSYKITLSVTDNNGLKASISKTTMIIDPANNLRIIWERPLAEAVQNTVSPAMSPDEKTVYMIADRADANGDLKLYAYDAGDGTVKWEYNVDQALGSLNPGGNPRQVFCSPSVGADGTVYLAVRDLQSTGANRRSFLFAITANGTPKWQYGFGYDVNFNYLTVAIGSNGDVYAGGLTNTPFNVVVLNATTGAEIKHIASPVGIRTGLALSKTGDVYFASTGANGVFGYNVASSTQKFNYKPAGLSTTGGAFSIDADGTIFTTSTIGSNGGILAINADGTLKWKFETEEPVTNCVPLVDNREYIHFITDNGTYYVIKNDGTLYGTMHLGLRSFSSPVMDNEGNVYIASEKELGTSTMICLTARAQGPSDSAWPMKGQNSRRTHLQK